MLQRIIDRWRQKEYRHYFWLVLGAKIAGVLLCLAIIKGFTWFLFTPALADDAAAAPPPAYINPINTMWTVIAAFLVFFMQAGFMFLEAGFARTRETVNVILEGIVDTCLCGVLFYAWGFAFMFSHGNGFIGYHVVLLAGRPGYLRRLRASHSWPTGSSSSPSRIRAAPSPPAPWSAAPASWATSCTASASAASSTRSSVTGRGAGRVAYTTIHRQCRSTTSPDPRSFTRSAGSSLSRAPSSSAPASAASSSATAADRCRATTWPSRPSAASSSGSAGTGSIPAARSRRWMPLVAVASRRTRRWPPAPAA